MIQAIVFLPLLGFILRLRSRWPARGTHPGAEPRTTIIMRRRMGSRPCGGRPRGHPRRRITSRGDDDHHAPAEPQPGSRAAEIITTSFLMIAAVLAWITFWRSASAIRTSASRCSPG